MDFQVNVFFGRNFLCSTNSLNKASIVLDAYRLDIESHLALFDTKHIMRRTAENEVASALAVFLSDERFFSQNCNYLFDSNDYMRTHGSISGIHPIVHYIVFGDRAGLRIGQHFWTDWVRDRYPNDARTTLHIHMEDQDWVAPNPYFDPIWYLNSHPDVFRAGANPFWHYLRYGRKEGRSPHGLVDWEWYDAVTSRGKPDWTDYLGDRFRVGVFPHPRARSGWAYLTDKELEKLFEDNLSPVINIVRKEVVPRHQLMPPPAFDALRSIASTFSHDSALDLVEKLSGIYATDTQLQSKRVSVVIPTKNRLSKLRHAVESVISQMHTNVEILVVDDGGDDGTVKWIQSLEDQRVRVFECPPRGVSAARNTALDNATGDYIAFLDSDNVMLPNFISSMLAFCKESKANFAYAGLRLYNDKGEVRYRFKQYDASSYWKTNYIDMNVIFHRNDIFSNVRFDEDIRRCVDWDYILRLCQIETPIGVPVIGCDYYHDGGGIDRITLSGPVWDCFRVSQRHRPIVEKTVVASSVFVLPVIPQNAEVVIKLLSSELYFLPTNIKVQCVIPASMPKKHMEAIFSLLASGGHPQPLLCHMPADEGTLVDYGLALSAVSAQYWHVVRSSESTSLLTLHGQAISAGSSTTMVPHCNDDGLYLSLQNPPTSQRWERAWTDRVDASARSVPLEFDLLNLKQESIHALDLRCGGFLALSLLALNEQKKRGSWGILLGTKESARGRRKSPYMEGLRLLNSLHEYAPQGAPTNSDLKSPSTSLLYEVNQSILDTVPVRSTVSRGVRLAIFTAAPHRGSGWGDEFYAESLGQELAGLGIKTDVIYRKNWRQIRNEYSHILHIRGIVQASLKEGCRNLMWIISHPDAVGTGELSGCDYVFSASRLHAQELAREYGEKILFLPQCTSFEPSPGMRPSSGYGILQRHAVFVGDSKNVLRYPLDDLIKNWGRFVLVGPNWKNTEGMGPRYRKQGIANERLPEIYRNFGAVLNQHWPDMARLGFVSNRLYDVAASGGYFITDECGGMSEELLQFGVVWRGGAIEDLFSQRPIFTEEERYERAKGFYEMNSFRARALIVRNLVNQG